MSSPIYTVADATLTLPDGSPYIHKFDTLDDAYEYIINHNSLTQTITVIIGSLTSTIFVGQEDEDD